jgi:hypothetical protein
MFVVPLHQIDHQELVDWSFDVSFAFGIPPEPEPPRPLPLVIDVLDAFARGGCHGTAWFRVDGLDVAECFPSCTGLAECAAAGWLDVGEVSLREPGTDDAHAATADEATVHEATTDETTAHEATTDETTADEPPSHSSPSHSSPSHSGDSPSHSGDRDAATAGQRAHDTAARDAAVLDQPVLDPPVLDPESQVDSVAFRKPNPKAVLHAATQLARTAGPLLVFDDLADRVFVVAPGDTYDGLAKYWPW